MGLFFDLQNLSEAATNAGLEYIFKSVHDHDGEGTWQPHESLFIRRLIEMFTDRGLTQINAVKTELLAWEAGAHHTPGAKPINTPGAINRWSEDERALVRLYLESLPVDQWTLDDHMLCIDYVVQTYLPPDTMASEAQWLATRASLMGKVQANMAASPTAKQADALLAAMPLTVAGARAQYNLPPAEAAMMDFARVRAAENVRALTDVVRHKMRGVIVRDLEQKAVGNPTVGAQSLQSKLFDEFATLNRDWRRIAVTEAGEAQLTGFLAALPYGTHVKRVEQYANACAFCRKIDGKVVEFVDAAMADKDPETMIWLGKTNVGRSASTHKRVGDLMVKRDPDEMWTIPVGLVHPNCRGRWVRVLEADEGDDPDFAAWLQANLGG
jgi:hypothetical protein